MNESDINSENRIDVGSLLDSSGWSSYQKLITALAAVVTILDGFDIQILAFAIPVLTREWHLERSRFGPVLAIGLVGMALGSVVAGYCGDRWGRRPAIIGSVLVFSVATIATALAEGLAALTVLRFFTGLGTGGALPNVSALVAEFAPLRRRASAVKLTILCVPLGGMFGGFLAASILPKLGWKGLYALGGGLPLVLACALLVALPESPRFLSRRKKGWLKLTALLRRFGHVLPEGTSFETAVDGEQKRTSLLGLFAGGLKRDTQGLWVSFFFGLGAIYLVFGWLPALLASQGFSVGAASSGLAIYNFGGVLGILLWAMLMPAFGSRGLLVFGALGGAITCWGLAFVSFWHGSHSALILGIAIGGFLTNAVQTSMYALAAHVYPTNVRATGVAYSVMVGRLGGLVSSLLGGLVIRAGAVRYWIVLGLAMSCAAAGLAWVRQHYPAHGKMQPATTD